jgi:TctA family transporter
MSDFLLSLAMKFGPAEYLALFACSLLAVALVTSRDLLLASGAIATGALIATVGTEVNSGVARFTLDNALLIEGISASLVLVAFVLLPRLLVVHEPRTVVAKYLQRKLGAQQWVWCRGFWRSLLLICICAVLPWEDFFAAPKSMLGLIVVLSLIGIWFYRVQIPSAVLYLAFVYGPMFEENLRRSLLLAKDDVAQVLLRPIVVELLLLMCILLVLRFVWTEASVRRALEREGS